MASDLRGAVEELLLSHRALIEEALYPLHEHAQVITSQCTRLCCCRSLRV